MKNEMLHIKKEQALALLKEYKNKKFFIAKIDGAHIHTLVDYSKAIIDVFKFPEGMFQNLDNFDSYLDWMRDFGWISKCPGYILFIENLDKMMINYPHEKKHILELFDECIFPYWESEVLECANSVGEVREFKVFIID